VGAILPTFRPTDPHRGAQTRIMLNSQPAESPADQGEGDSDESCRRDLDASHPAENREVRGSIPSLPTRFSLVRPPGGQSDRVAVKQNWMQAKKNSPCSPSWCCSAAHRPAASSVMSSRPATYRWISGVIAAP
jgi:hypothetical protein